MNKLYKSFIDYLQIPSEERFVEVLNKLPKFEEFDLNLEFDPIEDDLAKTIFTFGVLANSYIVVDNIDVENKQVALSDFEDSEQLEEVKEYLNESGWIITNYEAQKQLLEEYEHKDTQLELIYKILHKFPIDKLKEILYGD